MACPDVTECDKGECDHVFLCWSMNTLEIAESAAMDCDDPYEAARAWTGISQTYLLLSQFTERDCPCA